MKKLTYKTLHGLKQHIERINNSLASDKLFIYETASNHCVIALVKLTNHHIIATFALNSRSKRDLGIAKAFLSLVKNLRSHPVNQSLKQGIAQC